MIDQTNIYQRRNHGKVAAEIGAAGYLAGRLRQTLSTAQLEGLATRGTSLSGPELVAVQRFHLVARYRKLRQRGHTMAKAARACGSSTTSLWRFEKRLAAGGLQSLAPQTSRNGRRPVAEGAGLTPAMIDQVQLLCLAVGSAQRGWKLFAQVPTCPPSLARIIRQAKKIPPSLLKLTAFQQGNAGIRRAGSRLMIQLKGGNQ